MSDSPRTPLYCTVYCILYSSLPSLLRRLIVNFYPTLSATSMADYKRVTVDAIFAALRHAETRPNVPHSHLVRLDSHAELIKRAIADLGVLAVIQPASPAAPLYLFDGHDLATIFKEVKSLCSVDSNNSNVAGHQSSTSVSPPTSKLIASVSELSFLNVTV